MIVNTKNAFTIAVLLISSFYFAMPKTLTSKQVQKEFNTKYGPFAYGKDFVRFDFISLGNPQLKTAMYVDTWNKESAHGTYPNSMRFISINQKVFAVGQYFKFHHSSAKLAAGEHFRIQCDYKPYGYAVVHKDKPARTKGGLELACVPDTSANLAGKPDQQFVFEFVDGYGTLSQYDQIRIKHVETGTYVMVNKDLTVPTKSRSQFFDVCSMEDANASPYSVWWPIYTNNSYQVYYINREYQKLFRGQVLAKNDGVFLVNAFTYNRFRPANYGNLSEKGPDNGYLLKARLSGIHQDVGLKMGCYKMYPKNGDSLWFSMSSGSYLIAAGYEKIPTPGCSDHKGVVMMGKGEAMKGERVYHEWELQIVWGHDHEKGLLRSGDVVRLKNKKGGCYLVDSMYAVGGFNSYDSEMVCSKTTMPTSFPNDLWTINLHTREGSTPSAGTLANIKPADGFPREAAVNPFDTNNNTPGKPGSFPGNGDGSNGDSNALGPNGTEYCD